MVEEENERGKSNESVRMQMFSDKVFEGYKQEEEMRTYCQNGIIAMIRSTVELFKCSGEGD